MVEEQFFPAQELKKWNRVHKVQSGTERNNRTTSLVCVGFKDSFDCSVSFRSVPLAGVCFICKTFF
jgi:hypothetical protein